jgi:hypothetical protein
LNLKTSVASVTTEIDPYGATTGMVTATSNIS